MDDRFIRTNRIPVRISLSFSVSLSISSTHCITHTHLQTRKTIRPPELAKREELNATKIAIKFSTVLNKDMVFSGLRDFVIRIGEAVASGQQVAIAFSLGVLHASERKVTFAFDPEVTKMTQRSSKTQEVDLKTDESSTMVEAQQTETSVECDDGDDEVENTVKDEPIVPETTAVDEEEEVQEEEVFQQQQQQQQQQHDSFGGLSVMPSERSIASEIQGLETSGVVEQAYRRYLQDVQQRVEEAAFEKERFIRQVKEERDEAERRRAERKQNSLDLQKYLMSQMSLNRKEKDRLVRERRQDGTFLLSSSLSLTHISLSLTKTHTTNINNININRQVLVSTTS